MALYRNIAGFDPYAGDQVGLTLLQPTLLTPTQFDQWASTKPTIQDLQQQFQEIHAAADALQATWPAVYDGFMQMSLYDFTSQGYYVDSDGSIFQWDPTHTTAHVRLALQDLQQVENDRGTAGALLMHLNQPIIAKDTAGYQAGGSYSFGSTLVSTPIASVQALPYVSKTIPTQDIVTSYSGSSNVTTNIPTGGTDTVAPVDPVVQLPIGQQSTGSTEPTTTTTPGSTPPAQSAKVDWLPMLTIGGLFYTMFRGEKVFKNKRKLAFIGGLGWLYYELSKKP